MNPASAQSFSRDFQITPAPSFLSNFAAGANSFLQGMQQNPNLPMNQQALAQQQLMAAFPTLAANKMITPGGTLGQSGVVKFGGQPWTTQSPGTDWTDVNAMLNAQEKVNPTLSPGTALTALLNSGNWREIMSQPATKTVNDIRAIVDAWKNQGVTPEATTKPIKAKKALPNAPLTATVKGKPVILAEDGKYYYPEEF
jgi:hypothetical protein